MKVEIGFDDFEALLEALTPRRRIKPLTWKQRARQSKKARRRRREAALAKKAAARAAQKAARVDPAGQARIGAAMAKIATGEPGRWLSALRVMEPGKAYTGDELGAAIGLAPNKFGLTGSRDLVRRGYATKEPYAFTLWHGAKRTCHGFKITDLGLRMARGELAAPKRGRAKRRALVSG